ERGAEMAYEEIQIRRDCPAVQIPQGNSVLIPAGASAVVTQSLGGSYTVQVASLGGLFRVAGRDADALGLQPTAADGEAAGQAGAAGGGRGGGGPGGRARCDKSQTHL